jgi:hypothetical protein
LPGLNLRVDGGAAGSGTGDRDLVHEGSRGVSRLSDTACLDKRLGHDLPALAAGCSRLRYLIYLDTPESCMGKGEVSIPIIRRL